MSAPRAKACTVAWAGALQQYLWSVSVAEDACIGDALRAACAAAGAAGAQVPWDSAPVGIFGEPRLRSDTFADGDRIELYRPLAHDPRERRRAEVARARRTARRGT